MKRKNIIAGLLTLTLFALPTLSFANTYQFVDTSGHLQSMEADTSEIALATAYNLGVHSGVMLSNTTSPSNKTEKPKSSTDNYYQFIDTSGNRQGVWAANSSIALATAYNLGVHSGVMLSVNTQ